MGRKNDQSHEVRELACIGTTDMRLYTSTTREPAFRSEELHRQGCTAVMQSILSLYTLASRQYVETINAF